MARDIKLSASRISTFLSCKQKYYFSYIKKVPKLSNPSFKLGLAVHGSLEMAGRIWMEKGKLTKKDTEAILKEYDKISVQEGIEEYQIHLEGKELIKKRLNNFMTGKKLIGLELRFGFEDDADCHRITSKYGVPLIGAIDKIEEYDQDTLLIIDYKTSKTAPTGHQMRHDVQLSIYDLVAKQMFPQYKRIALALDLLKSEVLYTYRTEEDREEFEQYLRAVYDEMLALKEEDVSATLNIFCGWCDFKDICGTYKKICEKSDYTFLPTMKLSDTDLVAEWEGVKATKKILENRERELNMILMEKIKRSNSNLITDDTEVYVRQNSRSEYDLQTVVKTVPPEDFSGLVNLNKKAVEAYMELNPAVKEEIEKSETTNYNSPFLAVRKLKKKEIVDLTNQEE